jgi:aspartyl-tRNA(Asn)/glutamyl-tRNA(Gln) amidotransferase subunit C
LREESDIMSILKKDVEHVAELARLEFSEEEKQEIMIHFDKILGYVDKLNELDTNDVDIVVNPYYIENKFRDDIIEPSMKLEDVIKNAPKSLEEYIIVPKIIE